MKRKIVGICICMLLILSMVVGSIDVNQQNVDVVVDSETMTNQPLWDFAIVASRADTIYKDSWVFGENTNANDGPPKDIYDQLHGLNPWPVCIVEMVLACYSRMRDMVRIPRKYGIYMLHLLKMIVICR